MPVAALPPSSRDHEPHRRPTALAAHQIAALDRLDFTAGDEDPHDPHDMTVETVRLDPVSALVRVSGDLDTATSAPLWAVLEGHLAAGRRFVRLDLAGVRFVDATALSGIVSVHVRLLARRGTLVITGVRPPVARVLYLSGLDEVLLVGGPRSDDDTDDGFDVTAAFSPAFSPDIVPVGGGSAPDVAWG